MGSLILLIAIVAYIYYNNKQISDLKKQLQNIKDELQLRQTITNIHELPTLNKTSSISVENSGLQSDSQTPDHPTISSQSQISEETLDQLWKWLAKDWPIKVGSLFILLAVIWFVAYAFLNNWIGPSGRITLGLITGSLIMIIGHWFTYRQKHQGLVIELLGTGITLVTVFSAQNLYNMFNPIIALLLSIAVMIALAYSSLIHQDKYLATFAVIIGGIAPLLTGHYERNIINLFTYLTALSIGSIWLSGFTNWRHLTLINLIIIWLYSSVFQYQTTSPYYYFTKGELTELKFFAISFISIFFASNLATIYKTKTAQSTDLLIALGTSLYAFIWIIGLVPTEWQSLTLVALSLIFFFGAYLLSQISNLPYPVYTYSASALFLLTCATMIQFNGPTQIVALSLIATITPLTCLYLFNQSISRYSLLYFLLPISLSAPSFTSSEWRTSIFHQDAFALIFLSSCLWILGLSLKYFAHKTLPSFSDLKNDSTLILILASIYSFATLWLINHATFQPEFTARLITLSIYLITGLFTYFYGQLNNRKVLHRYGQILTIIVILWLLLVETNNMELTGRILTFTLTGILLISSVLIINRYKKP